MSVRCLHQLNLLTVGADEQQLATLDDVIINQCCNFNIAFYRIL